jgi:hypothetical protein
MKAFSESGSRDCPDMGLGEFGDGDLLGRERIARLSDGEPRRIGAERHHSTTFGTTKKWIFGLWRIQHEVERITTVGNHVVAHFQPLLHDARHRWHALDIEPPAIAQPRLEARSARFHGRNLVFIDGQSRKPGDAPDGFSIDSHERFP